jgi:hypothetical protein
MYLSFQQGMASVSGEAPFRLQAERDLPKLRTLIFRKQPVCQLSNRGGQVATQLSGNEAVSGLIFFFASGTGHSAENNFPPL